MDVLQNSLDLRNLLSGWDIVLTGLTVAAASLLAGLWLHLRSRPPRPARVMRRSAQKVRAQASGPAPPLRLTSQMTWAKLTRVIEEATSCAHTIEQAQRAAALQLDAAELALRRLFAEASLVVRQPIAVAVPIANRIEAPASRRAPLAA
jgi:signal transduction histidine kinase